jgi:tetratricopeptide (TPR) repeat protein
MMTYNKAYFEKTGVKITNEPLPTGYDSVLQANMRKAFDFANALVPTNTAIPQVEKWIEQYPHVPQFKNYLANLHLRFKQEDQAEVVMRDCYEKHPDYAFSKLSLAELFISQHKYDEAAILLDLEHEGADVFKNREFLHESEWTGYHYSAVRVALYQGKMPLATQLLERCWLFDAKHHVTDQLTELLLLMQLSPLMLQKMATSQYDKRTPFEEFLFQKQMTSIKEAFGTSNKKTTAETESLSKLTKKVGRNELCPCGSGKKYKHCHG